MVAAVALLGEGDFTPMAAVAGTFAELAMEAAVAAGATRVIVNNGGDIALRAPAGERVRVGVVSDLAARRVTHTLDVAGGSGPGGVATSGFGGRSLTKGIASAAVALAATASAADALATSLANATNADDPAIRRCLAEQLDPGTDIRGHTVTAAVGECAGARAPGGAGGRVQACRGAAAPASPAGLGDLCGDQAAWWPEGSESGRSLCSAGRPFPQARRLAGRWCRVGTRDERGGRAVAGGGHALRRLASPPALGRPETSRELSVWYVDWAQARLYRGISRNALVRAATPVETRL